MIIEHKDGYWIDKKKKWVDHIVVALSYEDLTKFSCAMAEKYPDSQLTKQVVELTDEFYNIPISESE